MTNPLDSFTRIAAADHYLTVVAVARSDGSVHTSVVNAGVLDHPVTGEPVAALVAMGGSAKLRLLRRSGRVTLTVYDNWRWAAVDGPAELIGPDDGVPDGVDLTKLLRDVFTAAGGSHEDWDTYDRVMREERRTAVLVRPVKVRGSG